VLIKSEVVVNKKQLKKLGGKQIATYLCRPL